MITPKGVRFLNISAVKFYRDHDELASLAETDHWAELAKTFGSGMTAPYIPQGSRARNTVSYVIPPLPSPGHEICTTPEMAVMRFVWSVMTSPNWNSSYWYILIRFREQQERKGKSTITDDHKHRRRPKAALDPPIAPFDYTEDRFEVLDQAVPVDQPFNPKRRSSQLTPYERPKKKLLLPREDSDE